MRSPEDMRIIQIDVTNACVHTCSNCSRMCGHHKKPFFMDWDTFKRAVDSMDGFEGTVGIMGGEPTLHPDFERFVEYLSSKYPAKSGEHNLIAPTDTFMRNLKLEERSRAERYFEEEGENERIKGPGLWSSLMSNYAKYYEIIQDNFVYQCVNDHTESSFHQPVMVTRKDMGIPDDEWISMRDKCWMQMNWSASITPKGAFFCEIAAALDMLFDGPGGWPIEPGWWKRKPEDFGEQLQWCEWCGLALETRSRDANDGSDDASPSFAEKLKELNTPKFKKGLVNVYTKDGIVDSSDSMVRHNDYQSSDFNRLGSRNRMIYPSGFVLGVIGDDDKCVATAKSGAKCFDDVLIFSNRLGGSEIPDAISVRATENTYGRMVNRISKLADNRFAVIAEGGIIFDDSFTKVLSDYVINPGTLHEYNASDNTLRLLLGNAGDSARMVLYHPRAKALSKIGYDGVSRCTSLDEFKGYWASEKIITFDNDMLDQKQILEKTGIEIGKKYAVYGAGVMCELVVNIIEDAGGIVTKVFDSDSDKWGETVNGHEVTSPKGKLSDRDNVGKIVIGSWKYYREIRDLLIKNGVEEQDILAPLLMEEA